MKVGNHLLEAIKRADKELGRLVWGWRGHRQSLICTRTGLGQGLELLLCFAHPEKFCFFSFDVTYLQNYKRSPNNELAQF